MTTLSGTVTNQEPIPGPVGIINPARRVRTNSADAQDLFGEVLAEKRRPEVSEPSSDAGAESAPSNEDDRPEQSSAESGESEPRPEGDSSAESVEPASNPGASAEPSERPEAATSPQAGDGTADNVGGNPSDAPPKPVDSDPAAGNAEVVRPNEPVASSTNAEPSAATHARDEEPIVRLAREGEQARHRLDGIRHQLRNAASVDLAQVATQELVGRAKAGAVVQADQQAASAPNDAASRPINQPTPLSRGDAPVDLPAVQLTGAVSQRPIGADSISPQVQLAPQSPAAAEVARPASVVSNGGQSAANEAAASLASSDRPGQPDRPANLIGRADLLVRLAGENGASRGAVTALERIGAIGQTGRAAPGSTPPAAIGRNANPTVQDAVLSQVRNGLASLLTRGGGKMTVVLRPDHLGEVRVRVETQADGSITARFNASTDLGRDSLMKGLDALRSSLEARGVKVDDLRVDPPVQPTAQNTATTEFSGGSTSMSSNADGRPDQSPTRDNTNGNAGKTDSASEDDTASCDEEPERGIWTNLGLDAIA